jgi:hypothetical protein
MPPRDHERPPIARCSLDPVSGLHTAELAAEKQRAKDIIVQLKREVEQVLNESEASAQEAREASAQLLAAAQAEAGRQRDNVDWLQNALERAEERVRALEQTALSSGNVEERVASAVAKARAPLELRTEGLAVSCGAFLVQHTYYQSCPTHSHAVLSHAMQAQVKTLSTELEAERRKFSELHRKSLEVHHMEAALHSLQQELAEETSRSIAMEERLTEALHAEKSSTQAMVDGEMAKLRAARRALENERDAVVAAARKETEEARAALEAERSKSGSMKDRLKEEVMKLMQEREGSLLDHSKRLETALEQAQAEAAASRAEAEQLRAELAAGGGGGGHRQGLPSSRGAAPEDRALTARVEQLAADLGTEKEYSASLERQLKALTAGEPGGGMAGASPSPSVSTELTRSREAMARLRDELSGSRQQCAQLQAELAVQASVIERTETVVGQRHQLAGEVKRLRLQLEEEQQRARETELQLLNEVEILMRDLPGSLRSRSALSGGLMSPAPQEAVM